MTVRSSQNIGHQPCPEAAGYLRAATSTSCFEQFSRPLYPWKLILRRRVGSALGIWSAAAGFLEYYIDMHTKRLAQFLSVSITLILIGVFRGLIAPGMRSGGPQTGGFEDTTMNTRLFKSHSSQESVQSASDKQPAIQRSTPTTFIAGSPVLRSNYSRTVVVPRMEEDDITWISNEIPRLDVSIFVANNPSAESHPPKNKGHEVMIYLTYLIDHYNHLPDIVLFMHAHRWTHHNNPLLGFDASQMISSLNGAHVIREGYVNMRCHWSPGCPEWLRPTVAQDALNKQEQAVLERCWHELFPFDPLTQTTYLKQSSHQPPKRPSKHLRIYL